VVLAECGDAENELCRAGYHRIPGWSGRLAHPAGGGAYVDARNAGDDTVRLLLAWRIDDYDAATRLSNYSKGDEFSITDIDLSEALRQIAAGDAVSGKRKLDAGGARL